VPFSPFANDTSRKAEDFSSKPVMAVAAPAAVMERPAPRAPTPLEAASQASAAVGIAELPSHPDPAEEVARAESPRTSGPVEASSGASLDRLRNEICDALEASGHHTAAALLSNGIWAETDGTVRVEVNIKKTMLGLTMNAEAEKIVKAAARELGFPKPVSVVSAVNGTAANGNAGNGSQAPPPKRPAAAGSVQAQALAHPVVKRAIELFNGEVRSVLDLREKRNA
jgi:DNA polymerase-3 subunit gamma/tau